MIASFGAPAPVPCGSVEDACHRGGAHYREGWGKDSFRGIGGGFSDSLYLGNINGELLELPVWACPSAALRAGLRAQ